MKITETQRNTGSANSHKRQNFSIQDIRRMYFGEKIPQSQIAKMIGVSLDKFRDIFEKQGWKKNTREYTDEEIRRLYFDEMLSKSKIAQKLGIARSTVTRAFQRHKWQTRPPPTKRNPEEARKLHEKGFTHKEIAKKLGISRRTVDNYLKDLGVESRRKIYKSDQERRNARKRRSKQQLEKVKAKRDELFGKKCNICGIQRGEKRKIAIHRKDFTEHTESALWTHSHLETVNPDDWAALCVMCHRGIHWVHDEFGMEWQDVEKCIGQKSTTGVERTSSTQKTTQETKPASYADKELENLDVDDIKTALFGDECYFCGPLPDDKSLVIHKKDGTPHPKSILSSKKSLLELNPEEWQALCQKHHRYVHWAMNHLGMTWDDIESALTSNSGSELDGEI